MVLDIELVRQGKLSEIGQTLGAPCRLVSLCEDREEDCRQQNDEGGGEQQFRQGEAGTRQWSHG
ncbi:hypothetical protein, partial [Salmonella sp. SAL4357]|uniref:hypothetical protein n=1 Tax=Salmonella sp. SAL4357 TaxID=3159878 RepID=UPI00397A34C0